MQKIKLETIIIILFFCVANFIGYANLSDNQIIHSYPYGYRSSDMVQYSFFGDSIKEVGNYKYLAPWLSQGIEDTVNWYYPLLFHLTASLSLLSGFEVYDCLYFVVFTMMNLGLIIAYYLIARFNKKIALLSLPFMLFVYFGKFFIGSVIGIWVYSCSIILTATILYLLSDFEKRGVSILIAILAAGLAHLRVSEIVLIALPSIAMLAFKIYSDKEKKVLAIKIFSSAALFIILSGYYLIYFVSVSNGIDSPDRGLISLGDNIKPDFFATFPTDFGILIWVLIAGAALSLLFFSKYWYLSIVGLNFIIFNYAYILGGKIGIIFNSRNFMLPAYVAFFFGFAFYFLISRFIKNSNAVNIANPAAAVIISVILLVSYYQPLQGKQGLFNSDIWDGFNWIHKNSAENSNVLFLYGDSYTQTNMLLYAKRNPFFINLQEISNQIQKGKIERYQQIRPVFSFFFYEKGLFEYGDLLSKTNDDSDYRGDLKHFNNFVRNTTGDICSFDYYIIDKRTSQPQITQFNENVKNTLLKNPWVKKVFENQFLTVVKNTKPGDECLA